MDADSSLVTAVLPQPNHSGGSSKGYIVIHDIECPPGDHWAVDLGGPSYLQDPATQASVQYIVDAANVVQGVSESDWAWGAGTPGSQHGIHIEQAGYASFTRSQWLGLGDAVGSSYTKAGDGAVETYTSQDAADMAAQFLLLARLVADICRRRGWRPTAGSDDDLRQMVQGNDLGGRVVRHADISRAVGGTGHTDPGEGYPFAELLEQAAHNLDGTTEPTTPPEDDHLSAEDVQELKAYIDAKFAAFDTEDDAEQRTLVSRLEGLKQEGRSLSHALQTALVVNRGQIIAAVKRAQAAGGTPDQIADAVAEALGK